MSQHLIIHFSTSLAESKQVSEGVITAEHASGVSSAKYANERGVQVNKQMDEQVAQYLHLDCWLFWAIVHCFMICQDACEGKRKNHKIRKAVGLKRSWTRDAEKMLYLLCVLTVLTVCFFSTATKDDAITQLIHFSLISAIGHFEVYCLAFKPIFSKIFSKHF